MSDSYELVPLAHLYPGMVLADALLDAHGNVLLAEGAVLGEASIRVEGTQALWGNVSLAAQAIDGTALVSGDTFSFNALVGARTLDTLALGDDLARGLGRRTASDRAVLSLAVVLLAGSATAIAGPIAFVGLVVPHVVRGLVGPHHGRLLTLSMLGGALLVVVADTVGRVVLPPAEVQVGIMAAVVGLPFFLVLIRRTRAGAL